MIPLTILAPAIAIAGALAVAGVQTVRLSNCKANSAEIAAAHHILIEKVSEQNAKVTEFETAAKKATERGRQAVREAQGRIKNVQADRDRLATELAARTAKTGSSVAPVGCEDLRSAVQSVRKGLTQ
jgi:hypothetical protein